MFLMLLAFFVELVYAILPKYAGEITALIARLCFKPGSDELNIWTEIKDLKDQQSHLSVTDEFVQYARLQRKVDKLKNQVKQNAATRKQHTAYLRMGITAGIYVFHALFMVILMIMYRNEHLLMFPQEWLTPFNKIVAFPTGIPGALGFGCWVMACNTVIRRGQSLLSL